MKKQSTPNASSFISSRSKKSPTNIQDHKNRVISSLMAGTHAANKFKHTKRGSTGGKQSPRQVMANVANFIPPSITSSSDKDQDELNTTNGKKLRKNSMGGDSQDWHKMDQKDSSRPQTYFLNRKGSMGSMKQKTTDQWNSRKQSASTMASNQYVTNKSTGGQPKSYSRRGSQESLKLTANSHMLSELDNYCSSRQFVQVLSSTYEIQEQTRRHQSFEEKKAEILARAQQKKDEIANLFDELRNKALDFIEIQEKSEVYEHKFEDIIKPLMNQHNMLHQNLVQNKQVFEWSDNSQKSASIPEISRDQINIQTFLDTLQTLEDQNPRNPTDLISLRDRLMDYQSNAGGRDSEIGQALESIIIKMDNQLTLQQPQILILNDEDTENICDDSVDKTEIVCETVTTPMGCQKSRGFVHLSKKQGSPNESRGELIETSMLEHHGMSMTKRTNMKTCNKSSFNVKQGREQYFKEQMQPVEWGKECERVRNLIFKAAHNK